MRDDDIRASGTLRPDADGSHGSAGPDDAAGLSPDVSGDGRGALRSGESRAVGDVSQAGGADGDPGAVSGERQHPSGAGGADGGAVGSAGRRESADGFRFEDTPLPGGYLWWYVDGLSDDGQHGISIIVFNGSVFSPYYYWAGRRDPLDHVSVNVGLYGPRSSRWAMTERRRGSVTRGEDFYAVARSGIRWEDDGFTVDLDEVAVPHGTRIKGRIRMQPDALMPTAYALDAGARHWWRPLAPTGRITVELDRPDLSWTGAGYTDMNWGHEPIEDGFVRWDWSRGAMREGGAVLYDATRRDGSDLSLALRFDGRGGVQDFEPPARRALPRALWGVQRGTQADAGYEPRILRRFEDSPFYTREEVRSKLLGEELTIMHESLDLDRFGSRWGKALLPWRMPRRYL